MQEAVTEELYVQTIEACIASLARREALELQAEMAARFPPHVNSWSRTRVLSKLDLEGKRRGLQVCRQLGFPTSGGCGVRGAECGGRSISPELPLPPWSSTGIAPVGPPQGPQMITNPRSGSCSPWGLTARAAHYIVPQACHIPARQTPQNKSPASWESLVSGGETANFQM